MRTGCSDHRRRPVTRLVRLLAVLLAVPVPASGHAGQETEAPLALYEAALAFLRGEGTARDPARAAAFYRIAAEAGNPKARSDLDIMFYPGRGVDRDPREALRLFEQAAADGDAIARYNAGLMRARGVGGAPDIAPARRLLEAAAAQDDRDAQIALARLLRATASDDEGRLAALYWYEVAAACAGPDFPADARGELAELRQAVDPARAAAVRARARTFAPAGEPPRVAQP